MPRWAMAAADMKHATGIVRKAVGCIGKRGHVTLRTGKTMSGTIFPKSTAYDPDHFRFAATVGVRDSANNDHEFDVLDVQSVTCMGSRSPVLPTRDA